MGIKERIVELKSTIQEKTQPYYPNSVLDNTVKHLLVNTGNIDKDIEISLASFEEIRQARLKDLQPEIEIEL